MEPARNISLQAYHNRNYDRTANARGSMLPPENPDEEVKRLAVLQSLNILYSPIEERFERITRLLCRILNVPIAGISIVGKDSQWFKSVQGTDIIEVPRNGSFCAHTILQPDTLVVPDASADARFENSPLVQSDPFIRFYAGSPLTLEKDIRIGAVCICDTQPRELVDEDRQVLEDFAHSASCELKARILKSEYQDSAVIDKRG